MKPSEIYRQTVRHFLSPIAPLLNDDDVSEILINGHETIFFEKAGRLQLSDLAFPDEPALMAAVRNIAEYVNRVVDRDHHSMDARLPDGSRVHVIIPPSSRGGPHISIRKFKRSTFDLDSLVQWGSLSAAAAEFLKVVIVVHKNTIISGGTGTGKTSMLNALSTSIPEHERIIVIEDSSELQLNQPHTVYLEAQPASPDGRGRVSIQDLFVDSLRMRPDRIIVGEVRRGEALDMIQSMLSGHAGAMTTTHANTPLDAMIRLETMCLMSGVEMPVQVARRQVASAVNLVIQLRRYDDGSRRVHSIDEMLELDESGMYVAKTLYEFRSTGRDAAGRLTGEMHWTGEVATFAHEAYALGLGDMIDLSRDALPPPDSTPPNLTADSKPGSQNGS
ncbi:CpaF family protein [Neorhodopirellula pilleata]|uniref:Putative conjugal transfer protein n=1 Tax=Neorhodopirellula pilleata TaxID=2714738 RepID=A0A5C6AW19_9BACT|nr:ATPase, T2SS/T4P/T4SS family [Neorhodopirellula pilleata]TWU03697.1 putative conjugal transfer protein [Neorhodopirellula pilleata]